MMKQFHGLRFFVDALVFGSVTGALTSAVVLFYKFCAKHVIALSETGYDFARAHLGMIPIALAILLGISFLMAFVYRKIPNIKGGGIPTSIGILRGLIHFKWLVALIGTFFASLLSFLIGVPLGNEGPSVQIGTSIGNGSISLAPKRYRAWSRYAMTGGACAGFSVATGAPISGILFAIEEAHQRISPMIYIISAVSVGVSCFVTELLSPLLGVDISLFPHIRLVSMSAKDLWIPLAVGVLFGLFAVLFLNFYRFIASWMSHKTKKIPHAYKIFAVFALTLCAGLISQSFISTGHHLILDLMEASPALYWLILILLVRSALTVFANSNSITGGIFLPVMAIGAVFASILARTAILCGLSDAYYTLFLVLGITACISGMMKMPLTAVVFAVEALSCYNHILPVIVVAAVSFAITELFRVKSVNDHVLEHRMKHYNDGKTVKVIDTFVTVQPDSFAVGKQVRDIFWPSNLFVLSVKHSENRHARVDRHGGNELQDGDLLHIRYSTYDEEHTKEELLAIIGEQDYVGAEDVVV